MSHVADDGGARSRVETYLIRTGLAARGARVVPLTGDASDRKYFRLLVPKSPSRVIAAYPAPFDYDTLTFVNVADAAPAHAGAGAAPSTATPDDLGILALEDLGDVTLQAHLGVGLAERPQCPLPRRR